MNKINFKGFANKEERLFFDSFKVSLHQKFFKDAWNYIVRLDDWKRALLFCSPIALTETILFLCLGGAGAYPFFLILCGIGVICVLIGVFMSDCYRIEEEYCVSDFSHICSAVFSCLPKDTANTENLKKTFNALLENKKLIIEIQDEQVTFYLAADANKDEIKLAASLKEIFNAFGIDSVKVEKGEKCLTSDRKICYRICQITKNQYRTIWNYGKQFMKSHHVGIKGKQSHQIRENQTIDLDMQQPNVKQRREIMGSDFGIEMVVEGGFSKPN